MFLEMNKQTHSQRKVLLWATKEKATITKAITMPSKWKDDYQLLCMSEQVILARLRTGHNRLNTHMHKKPKMVLWAVCPCGEEDQTKEHILQNCERHDQNKYTDWPTEKTLNQTVWWWGEPQTDNKAHPYDWPDRVTANEKKKMKKKLCTLFISKVQV